MRIYYLLFACSFMVTCQIKAQSAKVVIDSKGNARRYLEENDSCYHIEVQDDVWISKKGCLVELWSASKGQGYLIMNNFGTVNIRQHPHLKAKVIERITWVEDLPECMPCLGKVKGWYKVKSPNGKTGFVSAELVTWDSICSV